MSLKKKEIVFQLKQKKKPKNYFAVAWKCNQTTNTFLNVKIAVQITSPCIRSSVEATISKWFFSQRWHICWSLLLLNVCAERIQWRVSSNQLDNDPFVQSSITCFLATTNTPMRSVWMGMLLVFMWKSVTWFASQFYCLLSINSFEIFYAVKRIDYENSCQHPFCTSSTCKMLFFRFCMTSEWVTGRLQDLGVFFLFP